MTVIALQRKPNSLLDRLRTIQLGLGARGAVGVGLARQRGGAAAGVDWSAWFDHFWLAKGAASLAASYNDLVGSQTLTVGVAPTLGANGWVFTGAQYLNTLLSALDGWTAICRVVSPNGDPPFGCRNPWFGVFARNGAKNDYYYHYTAKTGSSNGSADMVVAITKNAGYLNGSLDATWSATLSGAGSITIGRENTGAFAYSGSIPAIGIKKSTLNGTQIADASTAMAAL